MIAEGAQIDAMEKREDPAPFRSKQSRIMHSRAQYQAALNKFANKTRDMRVMVALYRAARRGESWAIKEWFDRTRGKAVQPVQVDGDVNVNMTARRAGPSWEELMAPLIRSDRPLSLPPGVPQPKVTFPRS